MSAGNVPANWKKIPGYGGLYEASDLGGVRRICDGYRQALGTSIKYGTRHVRLLWNGHVSHVRVARLVLMAFTGLSPPAATVPVPVNGDKLDDRRDNLKWGKRAYSPREMPLLEKRTWVSDLKTLCDRYHRLGGNRPRREDIS